MACATLLAACATAWSGSTSAGGDYGKEVDKVVESVSAVTPMTPLCRVVAKRLVSMSVAGKVSGLRPTGAVWRGKEDEAAAAWEAARCPTPALVALVFGAAEIAHLDRRSRIAYADGN